MSKRQQLMEAIREVLTKNKMEEYFCKYNGRFYRFDDIDKNTWAPKPGSQAVDRIMKRTDVFRIGNLKIYF